MLTIYSDPRGVDSHQIRCVIGEKNVAIDIVDAELANLPEDVADVNPYASLPTLVDRDLALYFPHVIMEYLDERFPHPPLMPIDPIDRARARANVRQTQVDLYAPLKVILDNPGTKIADQARDLLTAHITQRLPVLGAKKFYLSDEVTLADCSIVPLLWRLPSVGIEFPRQARYKALHDYCDRMFLRPSFRSSLTEFEREMR